MAIRARFCGLALAALVFVTGCEVELKVGPNKPTASNSRPTGSTAKPGSQDTNSGQSSFVRNSAPGLPPASRDTIRLASFNIQVLGTSKLAKTDVIESLVQVIRRFDVVAVQELRSKDQTVMSKFAQMINADGSQYDFIVGPRQGRTSSKEQYVFLFNTRVIEFVPDSAFIVPDRKDLLHREPMAARFRVRRSGNEQGFSFTLLNIHTDPDDTKIELDELYNSFIFTQRQVAPEDDVILLGDLNVNSRKLGQLAQVPDITWTVASEMTNTRRTKSYDNILFNRYATSEFTGRQGVFDLEKELGLTRQQALRVSDHLPVWAEFRAVEGAAAAVAGRPGQNTKR